MSPLDPDQARQLAELKAAARRSRAQGRRWYLRAVLMVVIGVVALYRGAQLNVIIGSVMLVLALMSFSLGRGMRRSADDMERKIQLMEAT